MNKTLGDRIKEERKKKGMSQEALGKLTNTSKSFLSEVENDKRGIEAHRLGTIAKALNVSIDYLFSGIASKEKHEEQTLLDSYAQAALTGLLSNGSLITSISWTAYTNDTEGELQTTIVNAAFRYAQFAIKLREIAIKNK
jgi:transcriptional regulator with XRE-family HTH domain